MYRISDMRESTTKKQDFRWPDAGLLLAAIFFSWILWSEAPRLHQQGFSRAWESNQKGYALLTAIRETGKRDGRTAYIDRGEGGPNAVTLYIKDKAWYFSDHTTQTPLQLVETMRQQEVKHMILSGTDERLPVVRDILNEQGFIAETSLYRALIWQDNSWETVPVYHLNW